MGALDCVRLGAALDTPGKRYAFPSPIPSHRYKRKLLACTSTFELIAPPLHMRTVSRAALHAALQMALTLFNVAQGIATFPGESICVDPYRHGFDLSWH